MGAVDRESRLCTDQYSTRVAIIGGGISGIAAARELSHHKPVVFEASDSIGGVWKHCSYRSTRLQTPRRDYEFSDYPWPESHDGSFPTHLEIVDYLEGYATHFDVLKFVRFDSKVVEIRFLGSDQYQSEVHPRPLTGKPVWEVGVQRRGSDDIQWYSFEFVVMCIGKYGDIARLPAFPLDKGPEVFRGKVMHSMDYCKLDREATQGLMKGKKVVVVGYKKSAIDLAVECAEANQGPDGKACTMLIRTLHWTVPSYSIWGLPFFLFYSTRISQFLHERPNQSFLRDLFCFLSSPLRRGVSRLIESYLTWNLPLRKYGLVPDHPFEEDYASCQMAILPENFFTEADQGRILFKKSPKKWWFYEGGIELEDKTRLEADVVMLATGFDGKSKLKSILPEPFRDLIENSSGVMPLYRQSLQFQNLNNEERNIQLEVIRGGRRIQVSIFDLVVGDVVPLKIGDQVPADGILISGHSLAIDESSMTGESKIIHKDQKTPFLMSRCKVANGYNYMLVCLNGVATFIGIVGLLVVVFVLVVLLIRYFTGHTENTEILK
ncbi:hypothetical protein H6P81_015001 [Aristolochia fimbriata]|uniref:Flavin-containing monooxygenase n=1 Tax=Aristolochia fimbriata TaxID=158543 RepID=A0AAV7E5J7_ARIFI|nr:hypothetical protein H6P81_015001 [Aristolochia fimbriata]